MLLLTFFPSILDAAPTGDSEFDFLLRQKMEKELARVERNVDRREAREKAKGRVPGGAGSPSAGGAASPSQLSDAGAGSPPADGTPQKSGGTGRGKSKDGTARKCANCGQVGHIKTNRKSVSPSFECIFCRCAMFVPLPADLNNDSSGKGKKNGLVHAGGLSAGYVHGPDEAEESAAMSSYSRFTL